jgi:hypothetical protein
MKWTSISDETKRKFSPETKRLLIMEQLADNKPVNIFIQTAHPPSDRDLQEIEENGARIRTVAQDILTGQINPEDIQKLAELKLVVKVELSLPMFLEEE